MVSEEALIAYMGKSAWFILVTVRLIFPSRTYLCTYLTISISQCACIYLSKYSTHTHRYTSNISWRGYGVSSYTNLYFFGFFFFSYYIFTRGFTTSYGGLLRNVILHLNSEVCFRLTIIKTVMKKQGSIFLSILHNFKFWFHLIYQTIFNDSLCVKRYKIYNTLTLFRQGWVEFLWLLNALLK